MDASSQESGGGGAPLSGRAGLGGRQALVETAQRGPSWLFSGEIWQPLGQERTKKALRSTRAKRGLRWGEASGWEGASASRTAPPHDLVCLPLDGVLAETQLILLLFKNIVILYKTPTFRKLPVMYG